MCKCRKLRVFGVILLLYQKLRLRIFFKELSLLILHGWPVISLLSVVIICFLLFRCCVCRCHCFFSVVRIDVIVLSVSPKMPIYTSPHLGSHPLCEFVRVDKLTTT